MPKEKSIKRNYFYNLLYEIVLIVTPFITTPYISRVLGADGVGIYSFTYSIVTYFILIAGLGTTRYGQREISYYQNDLEARSIAFWNTEIIRITTTIAMVVVYAIFSYLQKEYQIVYYILIINLLNVALDISWYFQGVEEFGKLVGRNIIFRLLTVLSILVFVRDSNDVSTYALCLSGLTALGSLSLWPFLKGQIVIVKVEKLKIVSALKTTFTFFIPTIAIQVYTYLDKTMIGIITNSSFQNGYYEQAQKVVAMALTFITSIGTVMIPRMSHYYAEGKTDEIKTYIAKSFRFVWMLSIPMCFGLYAVSSNFVPWFFGAGFSEVIPLLRIMSLLTIAMGINNILGLQYLIPTGRQNYYTISVVVGSIINFVCNLLLIPKWGATGAAIASVFAEFCIGGVEFAFVHKEISIKQIIGYMGNYIIAGVIMFIVIFTLSCHLSASIIHSLLIVATGIIIYFVALCLLSDMFFISNMKSIASKLHLLGINK